MANVKVSTGSLRAVEAATPKHPAYKGSVSINRPEVLAVGLEENRR